MNTVASSRNDREIFRQRAAGSSRPGLDVQRIVESLKSVATVSEMLRILGAAVILASMSLFLMQGWSDGNDIRRYLLLLTQTGLLAAAGFALSHGLRETRGARVFFGLALISIPANFTILGALVYSVIQLDGALSTYPGFATWRIDDVAGIGVTMLGAFALLTPVAMFCYAIMARHSAKALTLAFLPLNMLLLVPVRESVVAGALALAGTACALWVAGRLSRQDAALATAEGRFALMTLFIPVGIVLFRSMYFYDVDSLMVAMLAGALFLALRPVAVSPERHRVLAAAADIASLPLALVAACAACGSLDFLDGEVLAPLAALLYAAMATDVLRRTANRIVSAFTAFTISLFVAGGFVLSVVIDASVATALVAMLAGVLLGLGGSWLGSRSAMVAGVSTMLAAAALGFEPLAELVMASSWIALAGFGAAAIALGSVIERHGVRLKLFVVERAGALRQQREQTVLDD